jgi:hypothetical protein
MLTSESNRQQYDDTKSPLFASVCYTVRNAYPAVDAAQGSGGGQAAPEGTDKIFQRMNTPEKMP